ncbi:8-amino-7-oxononanoate synthase [Stenotrophomonas rhizophila]|uniref:8-amino-7-oxononanoate synthase n=1 Tax=Stenotrophomonas rhizophila TaxID=216778 RepID=A0AAP5E8V4_9GAMM|nr:MULTISPECIES: 8-amino-7-oxononanoate synthase [Stenotrophomonas]AOA73978.1 8-amino-7-oxononanoate synthase [Stenotrophomonas rhizophila]MDQ1061015.1 8-amino-7-oxononanoate synthase [Stenotrophomonas sp. SORGH_AS_0282]MDQ1107000.1 8-amino-7-oxononanoate synthase [Stenotrophomonas rhizophila]MDQ1190638.1 8-amino-7-oxononanoate synthase [Stenotrophomonas sp. SORGH_AS_0282]PAK92806.1 8-amino-7-oxononanoate synthase [Stenotrophomonas rhizophila]
MARTDLHDRIQSQRKLREAQGRIRVRRTVTRRDGVRLEVNGQWLTGFCSNDYLGLSQQFGVVSALQDAAAREGAGAGASHLICGHHALHEALEQEVADWLGYPRALLFGSGFAANLAVQQALLSEEDDVCVQDRLNHASLLDATRLAGCRLRRYPHLDTEGALRQLKHAPDGAAMLVTDGVFSMDGDIAPLRSLSLVARMQEAVLYVDDAHGVGVIGEHGRGCVADAGLGVADVPLQLVTLGKALGGSGALVVGDEAMIQHLAETARPYIYTTAVPPAQAAAALAAVKLARRDDWRREKLAELVGVFRAGARQHGLELMPSDTPIQPLLCGAESTVMGLSAALEAAGFLVSAIRPPTVPEGKARLRVTLSALHTVPEVRALTDAIAHARDQVLRQQALDALSA